MTLCVVRFIYLCAALAAAHSNSIEWNLIELDSFDDCSIVYCVRSRIYGATKPFNCNKYLCRLTSMRLSFVHRPSSIVILCDKTIPLNKNDFQIKFINCSTSFRFEFTTSQLAQCNHHRLSIEPKTWPPSSAKMNEKVSARKSPSSCTTWQMLNLWALRCPWKLYTSQDSSRRWRTRAGTDTNSFTIRIWTEK